MKITLSEIWNFSDLIKAGEKGWSFSLVTGKFAIPDITPEVLHELRSDENYDTELLPSIFTFREILWQPDVFTEANMSLPSLRILSSFCNETAEEYDQEPSELKRIYGGLIANLALCCDETVLALEKERPDVKRSLGDLRTHTFPIIKFFINHPQNRLDYYRDAVNRLNYAVKIMLTQFHGRYTELQDPHWQVKYQNVDQKKVKSESTKAKEQA